MAYFSRDRPSKPGIVTAFWSSGLSGDWCSFHSHPPALAVCLRLLSGQSHWETTVLHAVPKTAMSPGTALVSSQTWENPNPSQNKSFQNKAIARKKRGHQVLSSMSQITAIIIRKTINPTVLVPWVSTFRTCFHSFDFKQSSQEKSWTAHSQAPQKDGNWSSYIAFPWVLSVSASPGSAYHQTTFIGCDSSS